MLGNLVACQSALAHDLVVLLSRMLSVIVDDSHLELRPPSSKCCCRLLLVDASRVASIENGSTL